MSDNKLLVCNTLIITVGLVNVLIVLLALGFQTSQLEAKLNSANNKDLLEHCTQVDVHYASANDGGGVKSYECNDKK